MIENPETGALEAFNFDQLQENVPELKRFNYRISSYQFNPPIDSSDMEPALWAKLVKIIQYNYDNFDGFVILHGTDTMAYTASALSFMLENLSKPVILTGSQLPIGVLRTDGKENLITSIEIAAAKHPDGTAVVPEVCIFFENHLLRGNRTTKINAENFNAFRSYNYPALATAGIHIKYEYDLKTAQDEARTDAEDDYPDLSEAEKPATLEEYVQQMVDAATAEKAESDSELFTHIKKESSSFSTEITDFIWGAEANGKAGLFETTNNSICVIIRNDITTESEWKEENNYDLLSEIKSDEFEDTLKAVYEGYTVNAKENLINGKYSPEKIKGIN